jgi:hypothetical protein
LTRLSHCSQSVVSGCWLVVWFRQRVMQIKWMESSSPHKTIVNRLWSNYVIFTLKCVDVLSVFLPYIIYIEHWCWMAYHFAMCKYWKYYHCLSENLLLSNWPISDWEQSDPHVDYRFLLTRVEKCENWT